MDPSTGTFISMNSYVGTLYDPVSLHKYLYANANPVMNTDPSGYTSLGELAAGEGAQISKIATEAFCNYVKVKALKGAIAGAVAGAVIGGIDSYLSGNDVTQIMLDTLDALANARHEIAVKILINLKRNLLERPQ